MLQNLMRQFQMSSKTIYYGCSYTAYQGHICYILTVLILRVGRRCCFFNFYNNLRNLILIKARMRLKTERTSIIDSHERSKIQSSEKKIRIPKRQFDVPRTQHNIVSSHSAVGSHMKTLQVLTEGEQLKDRLEDADFLGMQYFKEKYLLRDDNQDNIKQEMKMVLNRKKNEIESLRIYRDELKFISRNGQYNQPVKLSVQTLKEKAEVEEKLIEYKALIQKQIRHADKEIQLLGQYQKFMQTFLQTPVVNNHHDYLDLSKQQQVMLRNLETEKEMLIRELAEEQRRNSREIKQIQDEILQYRIMIKDKEDNLRNLKAKICTLYIKLHSRNNSRTGSKSKDRNMSLSIRKFNNLNHNAVKEAYIGNKTFKSFSKQIIQRVSAQQQLVKIKFLLSSTSQAEQNSVKNKQQLFFQCFYKGREGQIHDDRNPETGNDQDVTRDKLSTDTTLKSEEIYVKYLSSMKFFYKSKIVGVECRVKTEKGNKHIYIGNCQPSIEHELLTLVNKRIVTLGSFWHGKEMIGISVWYSDRPKATALETSRKQNQDQIKKQAYNEYYS